MSYLLFTIARIFGRKAAPKMERAFDSVMMNPDWAARKRTFEPMVATVKGGFTVGGDGRPRPWLPGEWEETRARYGAKAGHLMQDWEVVEAIMTERWAAEEVARLTYLRNVCAVFEPLVPEMKAAMTDELWEEHRAQATYNPARPRRCRDARGRRGRGLAGRPDAESDPTRFPREPARGEARRVVVAALGSGPGLQVALQ